MKRHILTAGIVMLGCATLSLGASAQQRAGDFRPSGDRTSEFHPGDAPGLESRPNDAARHAMQRHRALAERILHDASLRDSIAGVMSSDDASLFRRTITHAQTNLDGLKELRKQMRTTSQAGDTVAFRALMTQAVDNYVALAGDRKTVRDLLKKYRKELRQAFGKTDKLDPNTAIAMRPNLKVSPLYPNPSKAGGTSTAELRYSLKEDVPVRVTITDKSGTVIKQLEQSSQTSGDHTVAVPTTELRAGVYYVRIEAGGEVRTEKLVVE